MNVVEVLDILINVKDRAEPNCTCPTDQDRINDPACPFMQPQVVLDKIRFDGMMAILRKELPNGIHLDWDDDGNVPVSTSSSDY